MLKFLPRIKLNLNWIVALLAISVVDVHLNQERWKTRSVIDSDIAHYYSYLPALFYEKDLSLSFLNDTLHQQTEARYYLPNRTPEGRPVIKMSMGMAVGYLPFFLAAHFYASFAGYEITGFSEPYHFAVLISSLFYFIVGLYFLNRVLGIYFNNRVTLITLGCLCFGTNVYYYLTVGAGMSHTFTFALMSAFLYHTVLWYNHPGWRRAVVIGLLGGLMVLVRPVNLLAFLFFLLYDIHSLSQLAARLQLYFENRTAVLILIICGVLVCLPQLVYWKSVTGHYFFNSYVGEHFYFDRPHVVSALLGFRKGWLIYTPMMTFSIAGLFLLRSKADQYSRAIPIFFAIYVYVIFCWWCWWYGGSFGQRVLIDIYPILAIPMAAFFAALHHFGKKTKVAVSVLAVLLILLNLFQTIQAKYNIIHYDSMTREAYFKVFFTTSKQPDRENYLKHPDYQEALRGEPED